MCLDRILELLVQRSQSRDLLGFVLETSQLRLQVFVGVPVAIRLLYYVKQMTMDLEQQAQLTIKECNKGLVLFLLFSRKAQSSLHPGSCVLFRLLVVR